MRESAMRRAASCVSGVSCAKRSKLSSPIKAHRHGGAQTWYATVGVAGVGDSCRPDGRYVRCLSVSLCEPI